MEREVENYWENNFAVARWRRKFSSKLFPKTNFLVNATIEREALRMREIFLWVFKSFPTFFKLKIEFFHKVSFSLLRQISLEETFLLWKIIIFMTNLCVILKFSYGEKIIFNSREKIAKHFLKAFSTIIIIIMVVMTSLTTTTVTFIFHYVATWIFHFLIFLILCRRKKIRHENILLDIFRKRLSFVATDENFVAKVVCN